MMTLSIKDTQHEQLSTKLTLSTATLNIQCQNAKCQYAMCQDAECRLAKHQDTE